MIYIYKNNYQFQYPRGIANPSERRHLQNVERKYQHRCVISSITPGKNASVSPNFAYMFMNILCIHGYLLILDVEYFLQNLYMTSDKQKKKASFVEFQAIISETGHFKIVPKL